MILDRLIERRVEKRLEESRILAEKERLAAAETDRILGLLAFKMLGGFDGHESINHDC